MDFGSSKQRPKTGIDLKKIRAGYYLMQNFVHNKVIMYTNHKRRSTKLDTLTAMVTKDTDFLIYMAEICAVNIFLIIIIYLTWLT